MKKWISFLLTVLLLLTAIPVSAVETEFSGYCGEDPNYESITWEVNPDTGVLSITGTGPMYMYTSSPPWCYPDLQDYITSAVVSPGITRLPSQCFGGLENLKSVSLPEGITQVGRRAFYGCTQLEEVDFPDTVQIMYGEVFEKCPSLRRVHLSESLQYLCDELFYNCAALEEVNIPPNITRIYSGCFTGCELLQSSVHIPASVETIGSAAFAGCTSLRTITFALDGKLSSIGENAFSETAVESLELPWFLSDIGDYAFAWCKNLTSVTLPVYLQNIGADAFYSCCELESIMIPATVTQIGNYAFSGCESMQKITFEGGSRLQTIGERAFDDCRSLSELALPMTVTSIGEYAFCNCDLLKTITLPGLMEDLSYHLFSNCDGLEEVILPVNLKTIDEGAFRWCENLKTITIPKGLHTVQKTVFYDCENLQTVYYGGSESDWNKIFISSGNNPLLNADRYYNNYPYVFDYEKMNVTTFMYNLKIRDNGALLDGGKSLSEAMDNAFDRITDVSIFSGSTLLATTSDKAEFAVTDIVSADMILQKDGYRDYIIPVEVLRAVLDDCGDVSHNQTAYLTKDSKDGAYISTVFARETGGGACHKEIQKDKMQILRGKEYEFVVSVGGLQAEEVITEYCIKQENSSFKATADDGIFKISNLHGKLTADLPVLVYAKTNKGQTEPVEILLEKLNDDVSDWIDTLSNSTEYSFFGKDFMAVTIPESVPFVGGTKLSLSAFEFPFGAKVKGNQVYMSFGFDFFEKSKEDDKEWKTEWRGVKSTLKDYNKNVGKTKDAWENFKKMKDNKNLADGILKVTDKTTNVGFNVGVLGFAEAEISNNGVQFTEVGITLAISFKASYSVQAMVWVVPCYFTLEGGLENTGLTVSGIDKTADPDVPLQLHVDLHLNPYIKVAGGVGIKQAISLGPYGKVVVDTDYAFRTKHLTMDIVGSLGVEWQLLFASGDDTLCKGTFDVIDKYFGKSRGLQARSVPYAGYDLAHLAMQAIDEQAVTWYGNSPNAVCKDSEQQLQLLQQGASVSSLQLATVNNSLLAVWLDGGNLLYSVQDKNGQWAVPAAIADGRNTNMSPALVSNGTQAFVVWQQITQDAGLQNMQEVFFTATEICMAEFDGNAFSDVQQLTSNTCYDYLPTAFFADGRPAVLWVSNTANDLTAAEANSVYKWTDGNVQLVSSDESYILSLTSDGEAVAFVTDNDGNLADYSDLIAVTIEHASRKTLPVADALGVLFADGALYVHTADSLYTADGTLVCDAINGIPEVVSDGTDTRIVWSQTKNDQNLLYAITHENGAWGAPYILLQTAFPLGEAAYTVKNGVLHGICMSGNDFCKFAVGQTTDLALDLLLVDEQGLDSENNISVYVRNNGTKTVTKFICALSDSLGSYREYTQTCSLPAGTGAWFDFTYTPSNSIQTTALTAELFLSGSIDPTKENNKQTHTVGCCDLLFEQVTCTQGNGYSTIEGTVRNLGSVTAEKVTISLLTGGGTAIEAAQTIDTLTTDEAIRFTLYVTSEQLENAGECSLMLTSSTAELYSDDNEYILLAASGNAAIAYGDINADGIVSANDARLALRASVGLEALNTAQTLAADVDKSNTVTAGDARLILRKAVGLYDSEWPTE